VTKHGSNWAGASGAGEADELSGVRFYSLPGAGVAAANCRRRPHGAQSLQAGALLDVQLFGWNLRRAWKLCRAPRAMRSSSF